MDDEEKVEELRKKKKKLTKKLKTRIKKEKKSAKRTSRSRSSSRATYSEGPDDKFEREPYKKSGDKKFEADDYFSVPTSHGRKFDMRRQMETRRQILYAAGAPGCYGDRHENWRNKLAHGATTSAVGGHYSKFG